VKKTHELLLLVDELFQLVDGGGGLLLGLPLQRLRLLNVFDEHSALLQKNPSIAMHVFS
jgi:hypothetical protein